MWPWSKRIQNGHLAWTCRTSFDSKCIISLIYSLHVLFNSNNIEKISNFNMQKSLQRIFVYSYTLRTVYIKKKNHPPNKE